MYHVTWENYPSGWVPLSGLVSRHLCMRRSSFARNSVASAGISIISLVCLVVSLDVCSSLIVALRRTSTSSSFVVAPPLLFPRLSRCAVGCGAFDAVEAVAGLVKFGLAVQLASAKDLRFLLSATIVSSSSSMYLEKSGLGAIFCFVGYDR